MLRVQELDCCGSRVVFHPFFALVFIYGCAGAPTRKALPTPDAELAYVVEYLPIQSPPRLRIGLTFQAGPETQTTVLLPLGGGDFQRLENSISEVRALTSGISIADTAEAHVKQVNHQPNQKVQLEYWVRLDTDNESFGFNTFYPRVDGTGFYFSGSHYLAAPEWNLEGKRRIQMQWKGVDSAKSVANSFGAGQPRQSFVASIAELSSSPFVGGNFRVLNREVKGRPVHFAVTGTWSFSEEAFAETVQQIFQTERAFWNDFSLPEYIVVLFAAEHAAAGMATDRAFSLAFDKALTLSSEKLLTTIAHESFHYWIGAGNAKLQLAGDRKSTQ